jgi:predicted phage terminase large subunit-like protein
MNTYLTIDPVPPPSQQRKKGDYAAFVVTGVVPGGKVYVLEAYQGKPNLVEAAELLLAMLDRWQAKGVGIETAAGQRTYKLAIDRICRIEKNRTVPWVMLETSSRTSKEQRIRGLVPWVARGDLVMRRSMSDLMQQMLRFPKAKHDDLLDALAYGPQLWLAPRAHASMSEPLAMFDPRVRHPYMSYGWFMKHDKDLERKRAGDRFSNKRTTWKSVFHR